MFLGRGLRLGRISGIVISVDYSWFIIFALFVFLLASAYLPVVVPGIAPAVSWGVSVFTTLLFFSSVLVHELSHAMVARRNGTPVSSITLFIFGGVAQMEDEPKTPKDEFKMAIAGPLASLGIAVVFLGCTFLATLVPSRIFYASFFYLFFINVVLALFNLIPAYPMDGGRVFRAAIWRWTGSLRRATLVASVTGQVFGWTLIVLGVGSIFIPALRAFASIWLALIGWFVITAARNSYQQVVLRETLSQVPIRDVMNEQVEAVPADISVDHLVTEYFLRESASALPVERHGELLGMVSVEDVRNLPREQWSSTLVSEITPPMVEEQVVHPEDDAWDATNRMSQANRDRVLVTEGGHVEGIVTRGAILRWLQTHTTWAPGEA